MGLSPCTRMQAHAVCRCLDAEQRDVDHVWHAACSSRLDAVSTTEVWPCSEACLLLVQRMGDASCIRPHAPSLSIPRRRRLSKEHGPSSGHGLSPSWQLSEQPLSIPGVLQTADISPAECWETP
jgi:hypothetical protein